MPKHQETFNTRELAIIDATADATAEKLHDKLNSSKSDEWIDANQACVILKCSKTQLWKIQEDPIIQRTKGPGKNGKRKFLKSSLYTYLKSKRVDLNAHKA